MTTPPNWHVKGKGKEEIDTSSFSFRVYIDLRINVCTSVIIISFKFCKRKKQNLV